MELVHQEANEGRRPSPRTWQPIHPEAAARLTDSRLQLHHAAQFAAAAGNSFLEPRPDNSQTSLEWIPGLAGLFSGVIPAPRAFRVGVRPVKLALLIASEENRSIGEYPLHGRTMTEARDWVRSKIALLGADASRYALTRQYEIPRHDVAIGESFDASEQSCFEELSKWFANGAAILGSLARTTDTASDIRCWPHHFDIGTLLKVSSGRTIGVGLDPGDRYYDEPYFYVNMTPQPSAARARSRPLWGGGTWHTKEWIGAVLCGSRLGSASSQERQTREFLDSAISACRAMLTFD